MESELLFSRLVKTPDRRYFFDVYEKRVGILFTIKESRIHDGKSYSQVVHVWEESLPEFIMTLLECIQNLNYEPLIDRVRGKLLEKCQEEYDPREM